LAVTVIYLVVVSDAVKLSSQVDASLIQLQWSVVEFVYFVFMVHFLWFVF